MSSFCDNQVLSVAPPLDLIDAHPPTINSKNARVHASYEESGATAVMPHEGTVDLSPIVTAVAGICVWQTAAAAAANV